MQKQKQTKKEKIKKPFYFRIHILSAPLLISAIAYTAWNSLQKPVVADVRVAVKEPSADMDKTKEQKLYQGKYLSFSYPGNYREITHTTPKDGHVKESIFLSASDLEGKKIAVVVEERETGNFEESPSFQMRLLKSKEYKKEPIESGGFRGFLFQKNTQVFEETAFVRKENFIISISLSSPMSIDGLNKELLDVLQSLKWRK